jgi:hypothetical protein
VTDAPDPLGKRALFWAPAERDEGGPRGPGECDVPGKHALFSEEARFAAGVHPASAAAPSRRGAGLLGAGLSGLFGPIAVECSACGSRTEIRVAEFAVLHLPIWLWRPGRGYTRFMTCPACRRRTWVSASWPSWPR